MAVIGRRYFDFRSVLLKNHRGAAYNNNPNDSSKDTYRTGDLEPKRLVLTKALTLADMYMGNFDPSDTDPSGFYHFGYKTAGDTTGLSLSTVFKDRNVVRTANFKEKCKNGEIVMNKYHNYTAYLSVDPDWGPVSSRKVLANVDLYNTSEDRPSADLWQLLFNGGVWAKDARYPNKVPVWYFPGNESPDGRPFRLNYGNSSFIPYVEEYYNNVRNPEEIGIDQSVLKEIGASIAAAVDAESVDHQMVQECLADANDGTIDALTSIAELPQTFDSIADGLIQLARMFREFRKGQIRIAGSQNQRAHQLARQAYAKWLRKQVDSIPPYSKWKHFKSSRGLSKDDYIQWRLRKEQQLEKFEKWHATRSKRFWALAAKDVADEISALWLNYRYNISTNIYMLEDLGDTLIALQEKIEYLRFRKRKVITEPLLANFNGQWTENQRCLIKRRLFVDDSKVTELRKVLMANPFVTAWELVPIWSIVIDWFFTVGSCLRAIRFNTPERQQAASYSWKHEFEGELIHHNSGNPVKVKISGAYYRRIIISPSDSLGIYLDPDWDLVRKLDTLSFLVQKLSPNAKQRIYNMS